MASYTKMKREVIQHELGHWIAARHHDIHTDHIKIFRAERTYYGHCNLFIFPKLHNIDDARKLIESRIRTLIAGAAAQLIDRQSKSFNCVMEILNSNGEDDHAKIIEYISFASGFDPSTFMNKENASNIYHDLFIKYLNETDDIISRNTKTIKTLRDYILSKLDYKKNEFTFPTEELISKM